MFTKTSADAYFTVAIGTPPCESRSVEASVSLTARQPSPKTEFIEWREVRHFHCFGQICSCLQVGGPCSLAYTPTTEKTRTQGLDCRSSARHSRWTGYDEVRKPNRICGDPGDKGQKGTGKHIFSNGNIKKFCVYDLFCSAIRHLRNLFVAGSMAAAETIRLTAHKTMLRWLEMVELNDSKVCMVLVA